MSLCSALIWQAPKVQTAVVTLVNLLKLIYFVVPLAKSLLNSLSP
nr:MAG TPA: hypothetical protein [Bacteriophage sp.]